jgi:serine/threonine-protein kinase
MQPLLRRCLVKDPKLRLRDIGDAMPLLDGAPAMAPLRRPWPWLVAAVLAVFAILGWWRTTRPAVLRPLIQLNANLPPGTAINRFRVPGLALSPDGTRIAVVEFEPPSEYILATRRLDQSQFAPLSGTEDAAMPFFSPNGQWIGFFADGKLKKISVQGGPPVTLCDLPLARGASWGDDGNIVVAFGREPTGLVRVPSGGGAPTPLTEVSQRGGEAALGWPQVLPGSQAVLFSSFKSSTDADIEIFLFKSGERKTVHHGGFFGRYLATSNRTGYLVYLQQNTLFAEPFDLSRLAVQGARQPVLEDVSNDSSYGFGIFDFSQTGTFIYTSGNWEGVPELSIFWLDSAGHTQPLHSTPGRYRNQRFSPDGSRLAFTMLRGPGSTDIWVKDLARDATSRLTSLPGENNLPVWTPDGTNIVFRSSNPAAPGLYSVRADGSGEPQRLTDGKTMDIPDSFSPDGKWLALSRFTNDGRSEIWTAPVEGDRDRGTLGVRVGRAERFSSTSFSAMGPAFSPDSRWLAYSSDETGTWEVYARPFPGPGAKSQISTGGGAYPKWSRNRHELFFLSLDFRIMVTGYTARADSFAAGKPRVWSERRLVVVNFNRPYDLAPDGKRLAVLLYPGGTSEPRQKPIDSIMVLLNFFDELRRRVPGDGQRFLDYVGY